MEELEELARIGCSMQSTVFEFFAALKPRLSRNGKYDAQLDDAADRMVDQYGVVNVSGLKRQELQRWEQVLAASQLPAAWIDTFALVLGINMHPLVVMSGGTPASAAACSVLRTDRGQGFSGRKHLGKRLKAAGELERVKLPEAVFDAIHECPDYRRFAITYNDMKAINTAIFKWCFCEFGTVYIDMDFARHIEKLLLERIVALPPGRTKWAKIILTRFENGKRESAPVRCAASSNRSPLTYYFRRPLTHSNLMYAPGPPLTRCSPVPH